MIRNTLRVLSELSCNEPNMIAIFLIPTSIAIGTTTSLATQASADKPE